MPIDYEKLGEKVRCFRLLRNLTQEQLATLSHISKPQISAVERGERAPSLDTIINIANSLEIPIEELIADSLAVTANDQNYSLLLDCSPAESEIIIESMKGLKEILKKHDIN